MDTCCQEIEDADVQKALQLAKEIEIPVEVLTQRIYS